MLTSPANATTPAVTDVNFAWNPVLGAKSYQLQVSPSADFAGTLTIPTTVVKGTRYSPPATLNNGSYFWRVRASDAASPANFGGWSVQSQFTRDWSDRPTLLTAWNPGTPGVIPHVSGPLTFSWTPDPARGPV